LKIYKLPSEGILLTTTVENVSEVMNVNIVKGRVEDASGERYAEAEMNIFLEN
jgi:hypothetical protein